jgi:thioredoxin 1
VAELLDRSPEVRHVKVEDGRGRALGRSFQVRLWPNLVFLRDGRVVRQLARPGHDQLEEAFRELVGRDASRGA